MSYADFIVRGQLRFYLLEAIPQVSCAFSYIDLPCQPRFCDQENAAHNQPYKANRYGDEAHGRERSKRCAVL